MQTVPPLYKLDTVGDPTPLGRRLYITRNLILGVQKNLLTFAPQTKHAVREFLSRRGTSTYVFTVTDLAYSGPKQFFTRVEDALKEAKEVWMCVGEMGFRLMERDEIINGINFAAKHNGASIKVIHGPRTDPKTKRIFDLAKDGLVELFQLENYPSHHFLYIVSKTGRRLLIDESPHLEPVRARNQAGMVVEFYRSMHRFFYFIRDPKWLGQRRLRQAQNRIRLAERHRLLRIGHGTRGYPLFGILLNYILFIIPYTLILQPLLVFLDRLQSSWDNVYSGVQGNQNIFGREVEEMSERDISKRVDKEQSGFIRKIQNGAVIAIMSGSSVVFVGILMEVFLKIPVSNLPVQLSGAVGSAFLGGTVGYYMNKHIN